jgi:hypothetical protein
MSLIYTQMVDLVFKLLWNNLKTHFYNLKNFPSYNSFSIFFSNLIWNKISDTTFSTEDDFTKPTKSMNQKLKSTRG